MNNRGSWKYHTYVKPNFYKYNDPLETALNIFLKDLIISKDIVYKELEQNKIKQMIINTDNDNNNIVISGITFLKNKFLLNHKFKQKLIDYYNEIGIFVKGPIEILKRDGTPSNKWIIELSRMYYE
jgi:hypothetical protein